MIKKSNKSFGADFKRKIYFFILKLVAIIDNLPQKNTFCRIASDQILRSGTSIGANYIEASAGCSKKEFTQFFSYSLKSANETKFWLALLRDAKKLDTDKVNVLLEELDQIAKIFASSIKTLKGI